MKSKTNPKKKPVIRFVLEVQLFTKDGAYISDEQVLAHWDATDADWSQGAHDEMARRMLK